MCALACVCVCESHESSQLPTSWIGFQKFPLQAQLVGGGPYTHTHTHAHTHTCTRITRHSHAVHNKSHFFFC
jgi:hypothetical protein